LCFFGHLDSEKNRNEKYKSQEQSVTIGNRK
jgi:hypothetical protein